jgi:hypothetical protein
MLFSLAYSLARFLAELLLVRHRSDAQLRAEVRALRRQFRVLEPQAGRPRWQPPDRRLLLTSLCRLCPDRLGRACYPGPKRSCAGIGNSLVERPCPRSWLWKLTNSASTAPRCRALSAKT